MARWCLRRDVALSDDERFNPGCEDEWGTLHLCEKCPHNMYMGDEEALNNYGNN